jgi:hypothetical protein
VDKPEINCPGCHSALEIEIVITKDADWCCACSCISFMHFHKIPDHPVPIYDAAKATGRVSANTVWTTMRVRSRCTGSGSHIILSETQRG